MLSRMVEAVLIIMCTTAAVSTAVLLLGTCVPVGNDSDRANFDPNNGEHIYQPVCDYECMLNRVFMHIYIHIHTQYRGVRLCV